MIIAVGTGKGGTGKTTTAVGLATYWAEIEKRDVLLIDIDKQDAGSADWWLNIANPAHTKWTKTTGKRLAANIHQLNVDIVIIDTPPRLNEHDLPTAIKLADLSLITAEPSTADIAAAAQTILSFGRAIPPYMICFTKVDPRSLSEAHVVHQELKDMNLPVSPTLIRKYAAIRRAAPNLLPTDLTGPQGEHHLADLKALAQHVEQTIQRRKETKR